MRSTNHHELISAPRFSKWTDSRWKKLYKMEYKQDTCMTPGCKKVVELCAFVVKKYENVAAVSLIIALMQLEA